MRVNVELMVRLFRQGVLKPSNWYAAHGYTLVFEGDRVVDVSCSC